MKSLLVFGPLAMLAVASPLQKGHDIAGDITHICNPGPRTDRANRPPSTEARLLVPSASCSVDADVLPRLESILEAISNKLHKHHSSDTPYHNRSASATLATVPPVPSANAPIDFEVLHRLESIFDALSNKSHEHHSSDTPHQNRTRTASETPTRALPVPSVNAPIDAEVLHQLESNLETISDKAHDNHLSTIFHHNKSIAATLSASAAYPQVLSGVPQLRTSSPEATSSTSYVYNLPNLHHNSTASVTPPASVAGAPLHSEAFPSSPHFSQAVTIHSHKWRVPPSRHHTQTASATPSAQA